MVRMLSVCLMLASVILFFAALAIAAMLLGPRWGLATRLKVEVAISKLTHELVEHDDGWAYGAGGTYSETDRSHDAALAAAQHAVKEQGLSDKDEAIPYEDEKGRSHEKQVRGDDRPETEIKG